MELLTLFKFLFEVVGTGGTIGQSQSGMFIRGLLFLSFHEELNRVRQSDGHRYSKSVIGTLPFFGVYLHTLLQF
jgi:hypothetical protein